MMILPYLAFAKKSFLNKSAYRFDHIMGILNTLIRMFIFVEIYRALYGGREAVGDVTFSMVTTNFVLSIGLDAVFFINDFYLPNKIQDGSITTEMLLPINFHGRMLADNIGNAAFMLIFHFMPVFFVSVFFIGIESPASCFCLLAFLGSSVLGYGVLWSISFIIQMMSFWLINVWSFVTFKNVLINVLSGSMIPLWFMPDGIKQIMYFLPFSSIYFTPVQIYLGKLNNAEIVKGFLVQAAWITLFIFLGMRLWKKGQKKLIVQGG